MPKISKILLLGVSVVLVPVVVAALLVVVAAPVVNDVES